MNSLAALLVARRVLPSILSRRCYSSTGKRQMAALSGADILASLSGGNNDKYIGTNVAAAMETLSKADAVCFDVDSTVIREEGIDVLADYLGKGAEVAELTANAMGGSMKFQDALEMRLDLLKPHRDAILDCLEDRPFELTPGIKSLVVALHEARIDVYLVSGGFRIMIEPIAMEICVAKTNIYANTIIFDNEGQYLGFDRNEPTSADMGKPAALNMLKKEQEYKTMVMVGDGATDAQAKPPADAFIGFGGVVERQAVKEKACWFIHDFSDMERIVRDFRKK